MKPLLPGLLLLLSGGAAPPPAPLRVAFAPLTKAAYQAALKGGIKTTPRVTFPLQKRGGRIVVPTAQGQRVFQDAAASEDNPYWGNYTYLGYMPQAECTLLRHGHYKGTSYLLISENGKTMEFPDAKPEYSPDSHSFATIIGDSEEEMLPQAVQVFRLKNHSWQEIWRLEYTGRIAYEVCWASPTTLLLRKRTWTSKNPGNTFTYARLTLP